MISMGGWDDKQADRKEGGSLGTLLLHARLEGDPRVVGHREDHVGEDSLLDGRVAFVELGGQYVL